MSNQNTPPKTTVPPMPGLTQLNILKPAPARWLRRAGRTCGSMLLGRLRIGPQPWGVRHGDHECLVLERRKGSELRSRTGGNGFAEAPWADGSVLRCLSFGFGPEGHQLVVFRPRLENPWISAKQGKMTQDNSNSTQYYSNSTQYNSY